ncbi:MAG: fatty acid desaturase [Bacteriovoracia bacterium]
MKYSKLDLILLSVALLQGISLVAWAMVFHALTLPLNIGIFFIELLLFYFNPIVITHNFLHTPFFKSSKLNQIFPVMNSMNLGLPQILYKYHHLNHHRHNNSLDDPSSTYLFGKNNKQEHWITYCAFSLFRDGTKKAWKQTMQKKEGHLLYAELIAVLAFWSLLFFIDWKFFAYAYGPLFYGGWFLAHMENYFEHYKAKSPSDRFGNAVSFYPRWYNQLMFNEGYHQEHHISPQEHWLKRPETQKRFEDQMKKAGAYEAKWPPLLGMLE